MLPIRSLLRDCENRWIFCSSNKYYTNDITWQLLDLGSRYPGQIQTVAGRGGQPTLSHLTLTLARVEQAGQYECSPSNTEADTVTVHIVQGQ